MRRIHPAVRRFEIVLVVVCLAGLPFALWWPRTLQGKFYAALALPIVALAIALFATGMRKRRDTTDVPLRSLDLETWAAPSGATAIDTSRWSVELVKRVEWRRFEALLAAYFEALEFRVHSCPPDKGGGERSERGVVALELYSGEEARPSLLVACQAWNVHSVGIRPVRELVEAMRAQGVAEGAFATSARFTPEAQALAGKHNVMLIDGADLVAKIQALAAERGAALLALAIEGDFLTPTCPACGVKMTARSNAPYGRKFWGCVNYPRCTQTFFGTLNAP
jgi:restriction system protein